MILGYSANNVAALDKLITGGKPPVREYSQMDHVNPDYAALAAGGRQLCVSQKPKVNNALNGVPAGQLIPVMQLIPAPGKTTTTWDAYTLAHANAAAALPKPTMLGKHTVVNWHEGDVGKLNGTPDQICQAIKHMNAVTRSAANFSNACEIGVIIGDWQMPLIAQFAAALLDADKVLVDQPYIPAGVGPGGVKAFMDQRFAAMRALGVRRFGIGEWGVRNGIANRPAAIQECLDWMDAQADIDVAYYWDAPDVAIYGSPDQAQFVKAVNIRLVVPPTPDQQIATLTAELADTKAQLAASEADALRYKNALEQADAIIHPFA